MKTAPEQSFETFICTVQDKLRSLFETTDKKTNPALQRLDTQRADIILDAQPLSVFIPSRFGGRGQHVHECLSLLEACSYHSLPLSLVMGINGALFLQPLSKYGEEEVQENIFSHFLNDNSLGGLMITEPGFGSDALGMQTRFRPVESGFRVNGTKHWGGLTGQADYWLLTARGETDRGDLERNISFFVWDRALGGIEVAEYYENLGLHMIPYGLNRIDTVIPAQQRLKPHSTGVRMLLDLLHRSRLQFPGMAMGYLKRLLDEAIHHCRSRKVGGKALFEYDQVQGRLAELQAAYTTCSAMCLHTSAVAGVDADCSTMALAANSIKSVITDTMQTAAQSFLQLIGAKGYRLDHIAGRSVIDSRPFQIFEGSNDILYQQISESVLKSMGRFKESNVYRFLSNFGPTARVADRFPTSLNFSLDPAVPQRRMVELGRALGRIMSMQMVVKLGDTGFRKDLIDNCLTMLRRDVEAILTSFSYSSQTSVVVGYTEGSSWRDAVSKP